MWLLDITFQSIAFRILALMIIAGVHGGVVAGAAVLLGDKGPKYDGRMTFLPARHIDLVGAISLVLFGLGWSKPVAIDPRQFRIGRVGIFVVILAAFASLVTLAALFATLILPALTTLPHTSALTASAFLREATSLSIWFALASLIPVPPLTAGMLAGAFGIRIPQQLQWILVAVLFAAVATGVLHDILGPAHAVLVSVILGS